MRRYEMAPDSDEMMMMMMMMVNLTGEEEKG